MFAVAFRLMGLLDFMCFRSSGLLVYCGCCNTSFWCFSGFGDLVCWVLLPATGGAMI